MSENPRRRRAALRTVRRAGSIGGVHRGVVIDRDDPMLLGRVKVHVPSVGTTSAWAPVATFLAGAGHAASFVPEVGDAVVVAFEAGNPAAPIVVGALTTVQGVDPSVRTITTATGCSIVLDDHDGSITVSDDVGNTVTLTPGGIRVQASAKVEVVAPSVTISAGSVQIDAGMTKASGVVQCDTLVANSVVASSYTPGAGNVW